MIKMLLHGILTGPQLKRAQKEIGLHFRISTYNIRRVKNRQTSGYRARARPGVPAGGGRLSPRAGCGVVPVAAGPRSGGGVGSDAIYL